MLGANTKEERAALVLEYRQREKVDAGEVVKRGGLLAYDTPLTEALESFRQNLDDRAALRRASPNSREGLSQGSHTEQTDSLKRFVEWLGDTAGVVRPDGGVAVKLKTSEVDSLLIQRFFAFIATEPTRCGNRKIIRATATVNKHRGNLRACFRWLAALRPPLFPDFDSLAPAFRHVQADTEQARAFSPKQLLRYLHTALEYEDPDRVVKIDDAKPWARSRATYQQPAASRAATPVSRTFIILALTGCRLGEAMAMRWDDVDLERERGRITIRSQKTGRTRIVPLTGAPEGELAPGLAGLMRRWKLKAGRREFVLPHGDLPEPLYPKSAWQSVNALAKLDRIGPQMLRQNFVSYCASMGIPSAVAALWTGHSAAVAERWYRQQVLDRQQGESVEEAMGLDGVVGGLAGTTGRKPAADTSGA